MKIRTLVALLACAAAIETLPAQQADSTRRTARFIGEIRSGTTALPVEAADIRLVFVDSMKGVQDSTGARYDEMFVDSARSRVGVTNADGAFTIRGVEPGHYLLNVRRIGFHPFDGLLTIDTATVETKLVLTQVSAMLPKITINASATNTVAQRLDRMGFTTRYRMGTSGRFIQRKEILRRRPTYITEVLAAHGVRDGDVIIDRMPADWLTIQSYPADFVIGIEIYARRSLVPVEFGMTKMGSSFGEARGQSNPMRPTVVIWTYHM